MTETIGKLFFTRHGETTEVKVSSDKQKPNARLSEKGIQQVKKNAIKLKRLLDLKSKIVFVYDGNTERTKESLFYLLSEIFPDSINIDQEYNEDNFGKLIKKIENNVEVKASGGLGTMEKDFIDEKYIPNRQIDQSVRKDKVKDKTSTLLFKLLSNKNSLQYVLVGHKSNAESIVKAGMPNSNKKMRIDHDEIIDLDIVESEIRKGELDYEVKYYDEDTETLNITQKDKLYLNANNIDGILNSLKDIENIKDKIELFDEKKCSLVELQNFINDYFQDHIELYLKDFDNFDLNLFCLANLINFNYVQTVDGALSKIKNIINKEDSNTSLKATFDVLADSHLLELFLRIIYVDEKVNDELKSYFKERYSNDQEITKRIEYYDNLMKNYKHNIKPQIDNIRNKSIDARFQTYRENKTIDDKFDLGDKDIEENCLNILDNNQIVCIEGDGGSGKSFFSAYLQETLKKNYFINNGKSYYPIFVQLTGKKREDVLLDIKKQKEYIEIIRGRHGAYGVIGEKEDRAVYETYDENILYFFESLDEGEFCNEEGIMEFLEYIKKHNFKSIISTRQGYLKTDDKLNIKKYNIKGMKDPMKYVEDYFGGEQEKINKYLSLRDQIGEEYINTNSLFVIILCELIKGGGENLDKIDSKWKLFDAIVQQRLYKWEGEKGGRKLKVNTKEDKLEIEKQINNEIEMRLKILEEIAYDKYINWNKAEKKDMYDIVNKYPLNLDHESLSFLFKKNEKGEYGFIHKSLENYFLLRYYKERPDALDEIRKKPNKEENTKKTIVEIIQKKIRELTNTDYSSYDDYYKYKYKENLLMVAGKEGHIEMVEFLMDQGYDINKKYDERNTIFIIAGESGKRDMVKRLYNKVNDVEEKNHSGKKILTLACEVGNLDIVKRLLDKKVDINAKDNIGMTAFMWASLRGHIEIVQEILPKIENINEKDRDGKTAFISACSNGHIDIVKLLSEEGINIEDEDNDKITAFMWACRRGHSTITKRFIDSKKINLNHKDNDGMTAFMWACSNGHIEIAKLLVQEGIYIEEKDNEGTTAFMWACASENLELVQRLSTRIKDINQKDDNGRTALYLASYNGRVKIINRLYTQGMNINEKDDDGRTAFMRACMNGKLETVKRLFNKVNINEKDNSGKTAFIWACCGGRQETITWLYEQDMDINEKDNDGITAFMRACMNGKLETVKRLSDKVNINEKDNDGMDALMWACIGKKDEVSRFLSSKVEDINTQDNKGRTAFMRTCIAGSLNIGRSLDYDRKEENSKIDEGKRDNDGKTSLMWACLMGHLRVAENIIDATDKIESLNEKDNSGKTAFMRACLKGELKIVKILYNKKLFPYERISRKEISISQRFKKRIIDINTKDNEGITPFMRTCLNGKLETAIRLSDKVNINEKDNDGMDALMWACMNGHTNIIERLIDKIKNRNNLKKSLIVAKNNGYEDVAKIIQKRINELEK